MDLQNEPLTASEAFASEAAVTPSTDSQSRPAPLSKPEIVESIKTLVSKDAAEISNDDINRLKVRFYAIRHDEIAAEKAAYLAVEGNLEAEFKPAVDALEEEFKASLQVYKDKRAALKAAQTALELDNLQKKNAIIEELNNASDDADSVHRHIERVRELQQSFKEIGNVPDTETSALWKRYQEATEKFYDQLKVNKDLRDLDFKKNLELKTLIIEQARKLLEETDVVVAFRHLQDLHTKWREAGPVARELREEIWATFKDISAEINKKYQAFFEERKAAELRNEESKIALCERLEAIDIEGLKSHAAWEEATKTVLASQEEWKTLGFASRKANNELFKRFRTRCDDFFAAKAAYFKAVKEDYAENLAKKISLCEQAEELKESTDWKKASDRLIDLQTKWKAIGAVPRKHSDAVWARFRSACDYFFERKKQFGSETRKSEQENLQNKRRIIEQLKAIGSADGAEERKAAIALVRELMQAYQQAGHVPFREKDKIHDAYRTEVSRLYDLLDMNNRRAARAAFEDQVKGLEGNDRELARQRDRLMRSLETKKNEIKTFENNLGFFNSRSRSGEAMLRDMQGRIARLREELESIQSKIEIVESKINA